MRPRPISLGSISLSASRRLTAFVRTPRDEAGQVIDLRLQISDGTRWSDTKHGVRVDIERLPELVSVLEAAIARVPEE